MSLIPQLAPLEISSVRQKQLIIENISKMLIERKLVNPTDFNAFVESIISSLKDDDTCDILITNPREGESNKYHIVLLLDQRI